MIERRLKRAEYAIVEIDDILGRMQSDLSRLTNDSLIESLKEQTLQLSHYVEQMLPVMVRIMFFFSLFRSLYQIFTFKLIAEDDDNLSLFLFFLDGYSRFSG